MSHRSIAELFRSVTEANADRVAYQYKKEGTWADVTWAETRELVGRIGRSLLALDVAHGDRVGILSQTRLEWVLADFANANIGAVTVGIYPTLLADDCRYIIDHSDLEILFVENAEQLDKVLSVRDKLPKLRRIVLFDGAPGAESEAIGWDEFLALADGVGEDRLEARSAALEPDDVASIVYTSGTTGVPKGVMLTHGNLLFSCRSAIDCLEFGEDYCTLFFLPLAHVFARLIAYGMMVKAVRVAFAESVTTVAENLKEIRPHFIPSVPRVYEKVYDKIISGAESAGGIKLKLFQWAIGVGREESRLRQAGKPMPPLLKLRHAVADRLVLGKIKAALGGRIAWAASGAAPLNKTIAEFFDACGVTILEGIGMTENTSFSNVNRLGRCKFGTVGQPGEGIEQRIAEDGEVLFRGPNVMKGYFKDPEATAEVIDEEGWLHSGDIGEIDEEGYLTITDRKKDLIVTAGGKNVAPQRIERILRTSHYISQAVAYGDRRKFVTALITLPPDVIADWTVEQGITVDSPEALAAHPEVRKLIEAEIEERNRQLASFETVKRFHILPRDLSIESGELTPTLKIKRKVVYDKFRSELDALYDE